MIRGPKIGRKPILKAKGKVKIYRQYPEKDQIPVGFTKEYYQWCKNPFV